MRYRYLSSLIVLAAWVLCTDNTLAQPTAASPTNTATASPAAQANAKGIEGLRLYGLDKWAEAYEQFAAADALVHAPPFVLYMARCKRAMGKLLEAEGLYKRILTETLSTSAPPPFIEAQRDATRELEQVKQQIPTLRVLIDGTEGRTVQVAVDGLPVDPTGNPLRVDPGKHEVVVTWGTGQNITRTMDMLEGEKEEVHVELPPSPAPKTDTLQSSNTPSATSSPSSGPIPSRVTSPDVGDKVAPAIRPSKAPAIALLGAGTAGLVIGAVTGGIALKRQADVKAHCDGTNCVYGYATAAKTAETLAMASDVWLVGGGVVSVVGLIWLASTMRPYESNKLKGAFIMPMVGPSGISLTGAF